MQALALSGWASLGTSCGAPPEDGEQLVVELEHEQVHSITWEEYLSRARRTPSGGYVAEGDLTFTDEAALRAYYEARVSEDVSKLAVFQRLSNGYEPLFVDAEQVRLTYCVSNAFTNKSTVVSDMAQATKSWEDIARLQFVYLPAHDGACDHNNTNVQFAVMPYLNGIAGCGCSKKIWDGTFPQGCQTSNTSFNKKGVLVLNYTSSDISNGITARGLIRHELGHILGFRHEHPWNPTPICGEDITEPDFDLTGRQLTAYDFTSVMHYPWCEGVEGVDLTISQLDGEGARAAYGMPASWYVPVVFGG